MARLDRRRAAFELRRQGKTNTEIATALWFSRKQIANQLDKSGAPTVEEARAALAQGRYVRPSGPRVPCASSFAVAAVLGTEGRGWAGFFDGEE